MSWENDKGLGEGEFEVVLRMTKKGRGRNLTSFWVRKADGLLVRKGVREEKKGKKLDRRKTGRKINLVKSNCTYLRSEKTGNSRNSAASRKG